MIFSYGRLVNLGEVVKTWWSSVSSQNVLMKTCLIVSQLPQRDILKVLDQCRYSQKITWFISKPAQKMQWFVPEQPEKDISNVVV